MPAACGPEPSLGDGLIVSNDILELAVRAFIVRAECACYIQSRQRACGRGNFQK
jgi:hypothetical protein